MDEYLKQQLESGFYQIKLKSYDNAFSIFEKIVLEYPFASEAYFSMAVCLLKGKRAYFTQRTDVEKAVELVKSAQVIEKKGIYYYFLAYLTYDYFEKKSLNTYPNYVDYLQLAEKYGSQDDINSLSNILAVDIQIICS